MNASGPLGVSAGSGMQRQAVQPGAVRAHNLSVVLEQVRLNGTMTRARIAQRMGLARATVSDLVEQLVQGGMLLESGAVAGSGVGRPGVPLDLARRGFVALGLDIQVDSFTIALVDLAGDTVARTRPTLDVRALRPDRALERAIELAQPLVATATGLGARLAGVGIAIPGVVNSDGMVHVAPNLGWAGVDVAAILGSVMGCVPLLRNDADFAVRAELRARHLAGIPDADSLLFVDANVGVGGALMIHGQPVAGQHGWGNEIGHLTVDPQGPRCACGARGCLEVFAGQRAMLAGAGLAVDAPMAAFVAALDAGDPAALRSLGVAAQALGLSLANAINLVDVDLVVLGGAFAELGPYLIPRLEQIVSENVLMSRWQPVRIEAALTGMDAGAVGAAVSVLDQLFADPLPWLSPSAL